MTIDALRRDGLFRGDGFSQPDDVSGHPALSSILRLTGADAAFLIGARGTSGELIVLDTAGKQQGRPGVGQRAGSLFPSLGALALLSTSQVPAGRWTELAGFGAAYITMMPGDRTGRQGLVLEVHDADDDARARVAAGLADIVVLLDTHAEAEPHAAGRREEALAAALDQNICGVIVLNEDQSPLFMNDAAQALLGEENGIALRRGIVSPTGYHDAVRFRMAVDDVIVDGRNDHRKGRMLLLSRDRGLRPLVAVITPCDPSTAEDREGVAVLVHVMTPDQGSGSGLAAVCHLHGLSQVETRLVGRLHAGRRLNDAAAEMRIKPDTARAYLKQIFTKMGAHGQTELMTLIARYLRAVPEHFSCDID